MNDYDATVRFLNLICNEFNVRLPSICIDPLGVVPSKLSPGEHVFNVTVPCKDLDGNYSSEDFYDWCERNNLKGNINFSGTCVIFTFYQEGCNV